MRSKIPFAVAVVVAMLVMALAGCGHTDRAAETRTTSGSSVPGGPPTAEQVRAIAKDAYIYGFPMVDSYRIQYSYFINSNSPEYKGPWNEVHSVARVFTPADTAVQTPNSDTPYSMLGADLRAEPLVLFVPPIEKDRYYSLQFIDGYTANFAYVGSRATGNDGGVYLLAGPNWTGEKPEGIKDVIKADTDFVLVAYRTQLFGPDDLDNVKKIQNGYKAEPLSTYLKKAAPTSAPAGSPSAPAGSPSARKHRVACRRRETRSHCRQPQPAQWAELKKRNNRSRRFRCRTARSARNSERSLARPLAPGPAWR